MSLSVARPGGDEVGLGRVGQLHRLPTDDRHLVEVLVSAPIGVKRKPTAVRREAHTLDGLGALGKRASTRQGGDPLREECQHPDVPSVGKDRVGQVS